MASTTGSAGTLTRYVRKPRTRLASEIVKHFLLIVLLFAMLYPLLWMVAASFRPNSEIFRSLGLWSSNLTVSNYVNGWTGGGLQFSRYFLNSALISFLAVVGNIFACSLTAYAFARLEFPGRRIFFAMLLVTLLLPYHVTLVPQYILFNKLNLINSYVPLVLPRFLAVDAFFVFLMVQFIRALPRDLDDAARIDGCGHLGVFTRVIVPLALPAIGTTALFTFINTWNDFLGPMLYLSDSNLWTVPIGLNAFLDATGGQSSYGSLFAMALLSLAPLVGFFVAFQKVLIEGIATSGLK
ncbi:carbohydrate ABC transporter permease [Microlunatus soli]|uniref:Carbohydrate ABC transporter membrane protein 2, CUT1 family n=1 Tax=Microlunatus soli TaxID=630515 RepID=A0A1H1ZP87_9ACTN|nr:carbohydrate ABC transporter permease [Microlunatus soli]SDT35514.1 carbohydrate ABC transporter membrane protein 2, CUT1 family [Microlunatus soli]